jgi:prolipoprotein diacylglyceryltransferase
MMLFLAFVVCTWLAGRRAEKEGIAKEHVQDLAIWIFVGGIVGARIVYMIQYGVPLWQFFRIWEGGLVFYGSAVGGLIGYTLAYFFIIRKFGLSTWKIADIIAPSAALGLCLGRIGCLLNGCCYGNVAVDVPCPQCQSIHFPLSAPARYPLVHQGLQTAAGFTLNVDDASNDPRSVVGAVEPGSPAAESGLQAGDRIDRVDGLANRIIVQLRGRPEAVDRALANVRGLQTERRHNEDLDFDVAKVFFETPDEYHNWLPKIRAVASSQGLEIPQAHDVLWDHLVSEWPRGKKDLTLTVNRGGEEVALREFVPRTLGLHPTQLYESISMGLLFLLLTAFYPFRRHDGAVMVLFMFCYSVHRFLNEMLRNDTDPVALGMTLSQNGSLLVFAAAVGLGIWLWRKPVQYHSAPA